MPAAGASSIASGRGWVGAALRSVAPIRVRAGPSGASGPAGETGRVGVSAGAAACGAAGETGAGETGAAGTDAGETGVAEVGPTVGRSAGPGRPNQPASSAAGRSRDVGSAGVGPGGTGGIGRGSGSPA